MCAAYNIRPRTAKQQQNLCLRVLRAGFSFQQAAKQAGQQSSDAGCAKEGPQPQHPGGGQVQRAWGRECHTQVIIRLHVEYLICNISNLLHIPAHCSRLCHSQCARAAKFVSCCLKGWLSPLSLGCMACKAMMRPSQLVTRQKVSDQEGLRCSGSRSRAGSRR